MLTWNGSGVVGGAQWVSGSEPHDEGVHAGDKLVRVSEPKLGEEALSMGA